VGVAGRERVDVGEVTSGGATEQREGLVRGDFVRMKHRAEGQLHGVPDAGVDSQLDRHRPSVGRGDVEVGERVDTPGHIDRVAAVAQRRGEGLGYAGQLGRVRRKQVDVLRRPADQVMREERATARQRDLPRLGQTEGQGG